MHTKTLIVVTVFAAVTSLAWAAAKNVILDAATDKGIARLPIGSGVDAAAFGAESHLIFASNGGKKGRPTILPDTFHALLVGK
ncbi:MAG TPA: hypothetical protein VKB88_28700 [Bryobacteraceae bacterium]|nr:hypothetical protein [Bryobacteraceae bacterium]